MDSLTHIALGACIGEAFLGQKIGKKAMVWGALAQSLPDFDFIAGAWMPLSEELLAHRGFTHSILFMVLMTPLMALTADRLHRPHTITMKTWFWFFGTEICCHIFLDGFNNYGTGWFEPFSHHRFSFNAVYVADPFFSIWTGIAAFMLMVLTLTNRRRRFWTRFGIILPALYLVYAGINKIYIDRQVEADMKQQSVSYRDYFTTPAPFNTWLWYTVADADTGFYVGFRSVFDKHPTHWEYFPRNQHLIDTMMGRRDLQHLIRFSQGYYTIQHYGDSLVFNDLRFGQIIGWKEPREDFVFHYYLDYPEANELVVQRGRFAKWDKKIALALVRRAMGNKLIEAEGGTAE